MTRWDSSSNQTAAAAQSIVMVTFAHLAIPGDAVRVHDGAGTITWGGNDWQGVGIHGGIDTVAESFDLIATPMRLTLSGVDASLVSDAMTTQYHGKTASIYVGLINPDTNALVDTPEVVWEGQMDYMTIEVAQGQAVITLNCEHRLRITPSTNRYTDEDQTRRHAGDRFFQFLHKIPGYRGKWGAYDVMGGYGGGGGGGGDGQATPTRKRTQ